MTYFHSSNSRRRRRLPGTLAVQATFLVVCALALRAPVLAAGGDTECVRTRLAPSDDPISHTQRVLGPVTVEGNDLVVEIQPVEGLFGTLRLDDVSGETVSSAPIHLEPYEPAAVLLAGALLEVQDRGLQYRLVLTDEASGVSATVDEAPLRVGFSCAAPDDCVFVALKGLHSDGPVTQAGFPEALEEARSGGSQDLLGDVLAAYPELAASVYETALLLDLPEEEPGLKVAGGAKSPSPCFCRWIPSFGFSSQAVAGVQAPGQDLRGRWEDGIRGFWAGQTIDGPISDSVSSAWATLGMHMVCSQVQGYLPTGGRLVVGNPLEPVRIPILAPCEAPCEGTVHHQVESRVCAEARSFGGAGRSASADLRLDTLFNLDGLDQFGASAWVHLAVGATTMDQQVTRAGKSRTFVVEGQKSVGTTFMDGSYTAEAARDPYGGGGSYTFAAASSVFSHFTTATAACAPSRILSFQDNNHGGGEVLMRWGDPP